jgi:hypothetical protein
MALPFCDVLLYELTQVDERSSKVLNAVPSPEISKELPAETQALKRDLAGMGISGGGIRSATFNLGLLQGLAEHGVLCQLDYLSTVSGGGYVGSWLHGVIERLHGGRPEPAEKELAPATNPVPGAASRRPDKLPSQIQQLPGAAVVVIQPGCLGDCGHLDKEHLSQLVRPGSVSGRDAAGARGRRPGAPGAGYRQPA